MGELLLCVLLFGFGSPVLVVYLLIHLLISLFCGGRTDGWGMRGGEEACGSCIPGSFW